MTRCATAVALAILGIALPVTATPGSDDAALVTLAISRDGERVFAPRMMVRLGEMAQAKAESPAGGHRVLLSVSRNGDGFHMQSIYLARSADSSWVVLAEPTLTVKGGTPASMSLTGKETQLRFDVEIDGGNWAELRSQLVAGESGD